MRIPHTSVVKLYRISLAKLSSIHAVTLPLVYAVRWYPVYAKRLSRIYAKFRPSTCNEATPYVCKENSILQRFFPTYAVRTSRISGVKVPRIRCSVAVMQTDLVTHLCSKTTPNASSGTNPHLCSRFNCISAITMPPCMQQVYLHLGSTYNQTTQNLCRKRIPQFWSEATQHLWNKTARNFALMLSRFYSVTESGDTALMEWQNYTISFLDLSYPALVQCSIYSNLPSYASLQ